MEKFREIIIRNNEIYTLISIENRTRRFDNIKNLSET